MSAPTYEEMEVKRQEMIASFREIASAMTRCVKVIEEYTSLSPSNLNKPDLSIFQNTILPNGQLVSELLKNNSQQILIKEKKKKDKKPRDPNAPKRPPSAYIFFQNEIRDEVRNSNPGMSYKDILGVISQKWKDLTDAQRKVYEDAYAQAQINFVVEDKKYTSNKPPVPGSSTAVPDAVIDPTLIAGESDDTDDSDDSESDDSPEPPAKPLSNAPLPLQVNPSTLHAATTIPSPAPVVAETPSDKKKDKKRKNKDGEAVPSSTDATDKKKKKKSKD